jgi:hypothetical protein
VAAVVLALAVVASVGAGYALRKPVACPFCSGTGTFLRAGP